MWKNVEEMWSKCGRMWKKCGRNHNINNGIFISCTGFTKLVFEGKVTRINQRAFEYCRSITERVSFPITINHLHPRAFYQCYQVDTFRFRHTTPIEYFPGSSITPLTLPRNAAIEVPISAVATYKSTNGWKDYNIVGY